MTLHLRRPTFHFIAAVLALCSPFLTNAEERPEVEITNVTLKSDRRPVIEFTVKDAERHPIELSELDPESLQFSIATLKIAANGQSSYHNYILTNVKGEKYEFRGETRNPALAETLQRDVNRG